MCNLSISITAVYIFVYMDVTYVRTHSNIKAGNREYGNVTFITQHYSSNNIQKSGTPYTERSVKVLCGLVVPH